MNGAADATTWRAYDEAAKRHAPPAERLPLARAVRDALPATPKTKAQMRAKPVAAFTLGKALRDLYRSKEALGYFRESAALFDRALGTKAVELVDPLWQKARLLARYVKLREAVALYQRIAGILADLGLNILPLRLRVRRNRADAYLQAAPLDATHLQRAERQLRWIAKKSSNAGEMHPVFVGTRRLSMGARWQSCAATMAQHATDC